MKRIIASLLFGGLVFAGCSGKAAGPAPTLTNADQQACINRATIIGQKASAAADTLNNVNPYNVSAARAAITYAQIVVSEGRQFVSDCAQFFPADKIAAITDALDTEQGYINTARADYN